jgi:DNA-binding NarL/FixJ family response regulator
VVLGAQHDIEIVGEAIDGPSAVEQTTSIRPDVVVMDLRMPGVDGLGAIQTLKRAHSSAQILVLTTFAARKRVRCLRCGRGRIRL